MLAENRLTAAEEESRLAFDRSSVATCLVANDGRIIRVNPAICDLLGRSADELLTMNFLEVTHPDDVKHERRPCCGPARGAPARACGSPSGTSPARDG